MKGKRYLIYIRSYGLGMENELVSIIIPIYNVEKFLAQCIESVCQQSYHNIEILLIDDGSTDDSGKICDLYKKKDSRIKVIHKKNGGLSDARNCGIDLAKGDYIYFLDSDDYIHPETINILYNNLCLTNTKVSVGSVKEIDIAQNEIFEYHNITHILTGNEGIKNAYSNNITLSRDMIISCNKLFDKNVFKKIRFPKGKIHEDEFVTYKILYEAGKFVYSEAKLYYYRVRQGSITASQYSIKKLDIIEAFGERLYYLQEHKEKELYDLTLKRYLIHTAYNIINLKRARFNRELIKELEREYRNKWKLFLKSHIGIYEKLKATIFLVNEKLYGDLKKW